MPAAADLKKLLTPVHPRFTEAVRADARQTRAYRADAHPTSRFAECRDIVRLCIVTDAFLALVCYRAKAALQARGRRAPAFVFHRLAIMFGQVSIGDRVEVGPGLYLPHGQIVVAGNTRIARNVVIRPFVTIGLREGYPIGPKIEAHALIGTGAKIIGPVRIGGGAKIGANAVVTSDVPARSVAVGVPARVRPAADPPPDEAGPA